MKASSQLASCVLVLLLHIALCISAASRLNAEAFPLKHVVELALAHSTTTANAGFDSQRAFASYHEARNQYFPQFVVGSGLGATWGYPLSLEGSAPSIVNLTSQSAVLNP